MIQNGQEQSPQSTLIILLSLSEISTTWPGQSTVMITVVQIWRQMPCLKTSPFQWNKLLISWSWAWLVPLYLYLLLPYIISCQKKVLCKALGFHWFPDCGHGIFMCLDIVGWRGNARTISIAIGTRYKAIPYWIIQNSQEQIKG